MDVYTALMAAGTPLGLRNAGYHCLDSLSAEKGYRCGCMRIFSRCNWPAERRLVISQGKFHRPYIIFGGDGNSVLSKGIFRIGRHWHEDLRPDDTPLEGGLAFICKLKTDIPFLGRDALLRQQTEVRGAGALY